MKSIIRVALLFVLVLAVAGGVVIGALAIGYAAIRGMPHWQSVPSTWDAVWHANTIRFMLETGQDPARIVEERGLKQTSDTGAIEKVIAEVMAGNQDKVAEYRSGKDKLFGFFVGQVMKAMQGKANPQVVNELLKKGLG